MAINRACCHSPGLQGAGLPYALPSGICFEGGSNEWPDASHGRINGPTAAPDAENDSGANLLHAVLCDWCKSAACSQQSENIPNRIGHDSKRGVSRLSEHPFPARTCFSEAISSCECGEVEPRGHPRTNDEQSKRHVATMKFGSRFRRLLSPAGRGQQSSSDPPDRGPSPSPSANTKKSLASREPSLRNDDALRAATPSEQSTEPFPTISATGSRTPEEGLPPRPVTLQARLWERAYEALRTEEEKVVARYEDLVADEAPPGSQGNWNQLEDVVRSGLQKTRKESEVYEKIHTGMDAISSIKGPLSTAAHSTHEGAAAYLVLLFGLEVSHLFAAPWSPFADTRERSCQTPSPSRLLIARG